MQMNYRYHHYCPFYPKEGLLLVPLTYIYHRMIPEALCIKSPLFSPNRLSLIRPVGLDGNKV